MHLPATKCLYFLLLSVIIQVITGETSNATETTTGTPVPSGTGTTTKPTPTTQSQLKDRQNQILTMIKDAWNAYATGAWGQEDLNKRRVTKTVASASSGETILFSLTTLWLTGLWDEYSRGRQWIASEMKTTKPDRELEDISPLLSIYALTGDELFKEKAVAIARLFEKEEEAKNQTVSTWANQRLEYRYLSYLMNEPKYWEGVKKTETALEAVKNETKDAYAEKLAIGVKAYFQSNKHDSAGIQFHKEGADILDSRLKNSFGLTYVLPTNASSSSESSLTLEHCNFGALLSLGAQAIQRPKGDNASWSLIDAGKELDDMKRVVRSWQLATNLTETCRQASQRTLTGLPPSEFTINGQATNISLALQTKGWYRLTPELAESYFILWRLTRQEKYRTWAWDLVQAIQVHAKDEESGGFSVVEDINVKSPAQLASHQPAHFLGATLKYLWLTFAPDHILPLEKWVFTGEGQPLPVCGQTGAYLASNCTL